MKVPVMIELFRLVDAGTLTLSQQIVIKNQFASIVDGSPYELDLADDSDSSLYARIGQQATVAELIELMITRSSNFATNMLIDLAGPARTTATMHALGAEHIRCAARRGGWPRIPRRPDQHRHRARPGGGAGGDRAGPGRFAGELRRDAEDPARAGIQ